MITKNKQLSNVLFAFVSRMSIVDIEKLNKVFIETDHTTDKHLHDECERIINNMSSQDIELLCQLVGKSSK